MLQLLAFTFTDLRATWQPRKKACILSLRQILSKRFLKPSCASKTMDRIIYPDLMKNHVTAFFTGKNPGADPDNLSRITGIKNDQIYMPIQKHTDKIAVIESSLLPIVA